MGDTQRFWRRFLYGSKYLLCSGFLLTMLELHPQVSQYDRVLNQDSNQTHSIQGIGGAVWHGVKGFRNSPYGERRIGAVTAIKARAPVLGGNFGVWGGLFSTFDCAVKGIRKKEDPYNASMSYRLTIFCSKTEGGETARTVRVRINSET